MTKAELNTRHLYAIMQAPSRLHEQFMREQSSCAEKARDLITRCCRRRGAQMEMPYIAIASWLRYNEDHSTSQSFTSLYLAGFFARISALEGASLDSTHDAIASEASLLR